MSEPVHRRISEPHQSGTSSRLNWLRAGVLGANDGITSTAGLVIGVAAANPANTGAIFLAGAAGLVAGAASMAVGEYVSVASQRDSEQALIRLEKWELEHEPEEEFEELVGIYRHRGLSDATARQVATELHSHDALGAHLDAELGIDPDELTNPWAAAIASAISFTLGALLPVLAVLLPPPEWRIITAFVAVLAALGLTGWLSAKLGKAIVWRAVVRMLIGGALAMAVTYGIGQLFGVSAG